MNISSNYSNWSSYRAQKPILDKQTALSKLDNIAETRKEDQNRPLTFRERIRIAHLAIDTFA